MSNLLLVDRSDLSYCPTCADVYGRLEGLPKRCHCRRSAHLPAWDGGDFPVPFEICRYCQAEIIRSGSRWSTYFCDACRPAIMTLNAELDRQGRVSLPIGRHSHQHARLKHARPFTTSKIVMDWSESRLRRSWRAYRRRDADWVAFADHLRLCPPDLGALAVLVQAAETDSLFEILAARSGT